MVGTAVSARLVRWCVSGCKATLSDVKTLNKLVEQAKSTAEMGIVIPCGVVNLKPVPLHVTQTLVSRTLNTRSRSVVWSVVSRTLLNC